MSSRSRLLLLSGPGGAGTSTLAAASCDALVDEGLHPVLLSCAPVDGSALAGVLAPVLAGVGADEAHPDLWASLPGAAELDLLAAVDAALADPAVDVVVVDAGPLDRALGLLALPGSLLRVLDAAITPRLAMARSAGDEAGPFEALSAARTAALRAQAALESDATTLRVVTTPDERGRRAAADAVARASTLGVAVDGVIVNRCARRGELPRAAAERQQLAVDAVAAAVAPVETWKSTDRLRPAPKGRSVAAVLAASPRLADADLVLAAREEEFVLDVPLAPGAIAAARVGRLGDLLVVDVDGTRRWLALPSLLQRCIATSATRTSTGLQVSFVPDPATWRAPSGSAA